MSPLKPAALAAVCLGFAAGLAPARPDEKPKAVKFELRRAETKPADGLTPAAVPGSDTKIYLHKAADVTAEDIASASVTADVVTSDPAIEVVFTKDGAKKMGKLTEEHLGKPIAILVDGKVISAPVVRGKLSERAIIAGRFTKDEAEKIARALNGK